MKKKHIIILADASNVHTQKWVNYLKVHYKITVISLLSYNFEGADVSVIHSKSYSERTNNLVYDRKKVLFESVLYIRKIIKTLKPDLLHAHFASSYGLMGALSGFKPYIVSAWGYDSIIFPKISKLNELLLRYTFYKSNAILATSRYLAIETEKYTNKKIELTPFGVDLEIFKPGCNDNNEQFVVGITKSLRMNYGFNSLLRAIQLVSSKIPNLILKIVGSGEDEELLKKIVKELEIEEYVEFIGRVDHKNISKIVSSFNIAVFPSEGYESFGVAAVEASACEVPLIVSNIGGLPEVVENGINGYTINPNDHKELAKKVLFLYENQLIAKQMGQDGRKLVSKHYDWNENAIKMIKIYDRFLR